MADPSFKNYTEDLPFGMGGAEPSIWNLFKNGINNIVSQSLNIASKYSSKLTTKLTEPLEKHLKEHFAKVPYRPFYKGNISVSRINLSLFNRQWSHSRGRRDVIWRDLRSLSFYFVRVSVSALFATVLIIQHCQSIFRQHLCISWCLQNFFWTIFFSA